MIRCKGGILGLMMAWYAQSGAAGVPCQQINLSEGTYEVSAAQAEEAFAPVRFTVAKWTLAQQEHDLRDLLQQSPSLMPYFERFKGDSYKISKITESGDSQGIATLLGQMQTFKLIETKELSEGSDQALPDTCSVVWLRFDVLPIESNLVVSASPGRVELGGDLEMTPLLVVRRVD